MPPRIRRYSELKRLSTKKERFDYLRLNGIVAETTFGYDRYINQMFYRSKEWKDVRSRVIVRDAGCDLGIDGYEIHKGLYIHHMNPITVGDLTDFNPDIIDPEYLITVTHTTHNAIHYGDESLLVEFNERKPNDTKLW